MSANPGDNREFGFKAYTADQIKEVTQQLRVESTIKRMKVSEASKQLLEFCQANQDSDPMASGMGDSSANPFREKKACNLV